jgi:hypothetical protein
MKAPFLAIALVVVGGHAGSSAYAQTTQPTQGAQAGDSAISSTRVYGKVTDINGPGGQITVKTDAGSIVAVKLNEKTTYERMPPGETDRTKAVKIALTDISAGDGIYARGYVSEDRKSVPAQTVIVVSQSEIAKKQEKDRAEWRQRGIVGIISALNPTARQITITYRSLAGSQPVVIPVTDKVKMLRYAPDSIKFADAREAKFDELKVGDQLRALGDRNADGTAFTAEKVVTGSFKTVAGVITAIDLATGEVKINDLQTKQPLTIVVKQDAVVRKFPAANEMGGMMMMGRPGGGGGAGGQTPTGQAGGQTAGQGSGPGTHQGGAPGAGQGGGTRMGGGGNIQDMLERLPTIALADVKVGDTIIVSSTRGADPSRLTAISLISGADTLLNLLAARQQQQPGSQSAPNPAAGLGSGIQFGIGLP